MRVGKRDHHLNVVLAQGGPAIHAIGAFKAKHVAVEANRLVNVIDGQHGTNVFQFHGHLVIG
jgi:hypothetical protein